MKLVGRTRMWARSAVYATVPARLLHHARSVPLQLESFVRARPWRFAEFGRGSIVSPPLVVAAPDRIAIGDHVRIDRGGKLSVIASAEDRTGPPKLRIGSGSNFGRSVAILAKESVEIGRNVQGADRVFISDTYHEYADVSRPVLGQGMAPGRAIVIGDGVFLGVGCIVLPGVTIGERAYVGAGAVVTKDVAPFAIVAGNPAREIRRWDPERGTWIEAAEPSP